MSKSKRINYSSLNEIKGSKAEYFQDTTDSCLVGLKIFKYFTRNERKKIQEIHWPVLYSTGQGLQRAV